MFQGAGWSAHVLQDAHLPELQTLCEACPDYFILMDGHTASPDEAWRMMDAVPGDFDTQIHQKYVIGIRDKDERLIGVLEGVDGYPTTGTFYIGLLLVHPGNRGSGLAAEVITAFSE